MLTSLTHAAWLKFKLELELNLGNTRTMSLAAPRSNVRPSLRHSVTALASLLLLGLSLPAHSEFDFNSEKAVVVAADPPSRYDEYRARRAAEEEAYEHERAERERQKEARQLLLDQQARERAEEAQRNPKPVPSMNSTNTNANNDYINSYNNSESPSDHSNSLSSANDSESRSPAALINDYRDAILLVLFLLGMGYWLLRDINTPALTSRPELRTSRVEPARRSITPSAPTAPPPSAASSNASQPIDFHPVKVPSAPTSPSVNASNPINALAEQTLLAFANDQTNQPLLYRAQLQKAQLDYSAASLARVDHFLRQLRTQTQPDYALYSSQTEHRNLLILLGFYIGSTIARLTQQQITWYDYSGAKTLLNNPALPEGIQTLYSCMIGPRYHLLPIDLVCNMLFAEPALESSTAKLAFYQAQLVHGNP